MSKVDEGKQSKGDEEIEWAQEDEGEGDELGNRPPSQAGQVQDEAAGDVVDDDGVHGGVVVMVVVYVCV